MHWATEPLKPIWWAVQQVAPDMVVLGQAIEVSKTATFDGNVVRQSAEILMPCTPETEIFNLVLTKCKHTITVTKTIETEWWFCSNNALVHFKYHDSTIPVAQTFWVTIVEDITGSYYVNSQLLAPDCKVDLKDVFLAGKAFGSTPSHAKWNSVADINRDYKIDLKDYYAVSKMFGKW